MKSPLRPELPTASVGWSQASTAAVDNSAPSVIRSESTYKSGKVVQTSGATSLRISPQSRFDETELIKLGNAEIDEQHHRMLLLADAIVESLVNAGVDGAGSDPLDLLQTLIDFSYQHFQFEEDLMRSVDYPGTEPHVKEHSALLTQLAGRRYRFQLGHGNVAQITVYLRGWANRHIDHKDRELVDWLRAEVKLTTAIKKRNEPICNFRVAASSSQRCF